MNAKEYKFSVAILAIAFLTVVGLSFFLGMYIGLRTPEINHTSPAQLEHEVMKKVELQHKYNALEAEHSLLVDSYHEMVDAAKTAQNQVERLPLGRSCPSINGLPSLCGGVVKEAERTRE